MTLTIEKEAEPKALLSGRPTLWFSTMTCPDSSDPNYYVQYLTLAKALQKYPIAVAFPVEFHKGIVILTIIKLANKAKGDHMFTVGGGY